MKARLENILFQLENLPSEIDSLLVDLENMLELDEWGNVMASATNTLVEAVLDTIDSIELLGGEGLEQAIKAFNEELEK